MNGGGPTAQIIERDGWKCDKDFVGHRKAVTCVRFHNSILKRMTPKTNKSQQYCCLAVGARDKSLSVWLTALQRPLVVIYDLFQDSILDLSWSHNGYLLLACSSDGHVACLQFSEEELGKPLSEEDRNSLYQRMYGKDITLDLYTQSNKDMIIEYPDLLNATQTKLTAPTLVPQASQATVEKTSEKEQSAALLQPTPKPSTSQEIQRPIAKQIETKTVDGKRRITPVFIPLTDDVEIPTAGGGQFSSSSASKSSIITVEKKSDVPSSDSNAATTANAVDSLVEQTVKLDIRLKKRSPPPGRTDRLSDLPSLPIPETQSKPSTSTSQQTPVVSGKVNVLTGTVTKAFGDYRIQVTNGAYKTGYGALCRISGHLVSLPRSDKHIWNSVIGSPVVSLALSKKYVVFCSLDGSIRYLDIRTGSPVLPVLSLTSPVVHCTFSSSCKLAGVLTENCTLRVWDMDDQSIFLNGSCRDIMGTSFATLLHLSDNGVPFIVLANGSSFSYSKKLESWLITNSSDPVMRHGLFSNKPGPLVRNIKSFPLTTIQSFGNFTPTNLRSFLNCQDNSWELAASLAFTENQIKIAEMINSPTELKHWYLMLGFQLAQNGTEDKVRQVLDRLLGPTFEIQTDGPEATILGIPKATLLEEILDQLKTQPQWQRIYMEYTEQLKLRKQGETESSPTDSKPTESEPTEDSPAVS